MFDFSDNDSSISTLGAVVGREPLVSRTRARETRARGAEADYVSCSQLRDELLPLMIRASRLLFI